MPKLTLCMIVKNEEANLQTCLESIAPFVDEIVIVDTGSSDRTKDIALQYTEQVYEFPWRNDFAAARNFSISKAHNEYVLILDSDECVQSIDIAQLKLLMEKNPCKIGRLLRINEFSRNSNANRYQERVNRLFSKKYYQYEGIIHEQVVPIKHDSEEASGETYLLPLTITHSGYEGELSVRKRKTQRNIDLLSIALEKDPDDPYLLYQLGKSYYMQEDYQNACSYFEKALTYDLDSQLEYVEDMVESYGYSLMNSGQYQKALMLLNIYEEFSASADFIFMIALVYMNNGRFHQAIEEFINATCTRECKMEGVNDFLAFYNIGVIYECLGDKENAKLYYKKCKNYGPAVERLEEFNKNNL